MSVALLPSRGAVTESADMMSMDAAARHRIADYYEHGLQRGYVRGKLATDPVYAAAAELIAVHPLPLLDIGCGIGLLGQYLHAQGCVPEYIGIDHDPRKIDAGLRALRRAGIDHSLQLRCGDGATAQTLRGHVALLDVLHYLPEERQRAVVEHAVRHLAPDGMLIVRNVLRESNWRYQVTRVAEFFLRVSGWMRVGAQHYPSADELRALLEAAGLEVTIRPLHGHMPYNNYLLVAQRKR
ncbi:MAG TPA: class I SAM-dependent methyltransferase [Dyella sp.]|jgi:2-polyprenyl-3-methyl-5-hydroxy-6-metoxy-1,4-benzoquinol methylase